MSLLDLIVGRNAKKYDKQQDESQVAKIGHVNYVIRALNALQPKYKEYVFKFILVDPLSVGDFYSFYTINDDGFNPVFTSPSSLQVSFTSPLFQGIDTNTKATITAVYQDTVSGAPAAPLVGYFYEDVGVIYATIQSLDQNMPTTDTGILVSVKVYN